MKIYGDAKREDLKRIVLFVEIFANVKCFIFQIFISSRKLLNKTKI